MTFLRKLADRFLVWYCNPDFIEEIQGDIQELYAQRTPGGPSWKADVRYLFDVIRFFRWSNIRRTGYVPGSTGLWSLNLKMVWRNSVRHKTIFAIKTLGLALCLSFTLLLAAFIITELSADKFHARHDRIYRVGMKAIFKDHITDYAVTPLPTGQALQEGVASVDAYTRLMHMDKPVFKIDDRFFTHEVTLAVDSNFLRVFSYDFIDGSVQSLDGPNKAVLTETAARTFFGDENPLGQIIHFGRNHFAEVAAIIRDVPHAAHMQFDVLISWDTFDRDDSWGNINAYTYILVKEGATVEQVKAEAPKVFATFNDLIVREYEATAEFHFDKLTDIHFLGYLEEDFAQKSRTTNLWILFAVGALFLLTGLINYLNLSLAELTANLKKVGIVKTFGGILNSHRKIVLAETALVLTAIVPLTCLLTWTAWIVVQKGTGIIIPNTTWLGYPFLLTAAFLLLAIFFSSELNSYVLSRATNIILLLRGRWGTSHAGVETRKYLVGLQLCFSVVMIGLMIVIADQFNFIQQIDKGFEAKNRLIIRLRSGPASSIDTFQGSLQEISGVSRVAQSTYYPGAVETKYVFGLESEKGMEQRLVTMMSCSRNYLQTMDIRMSTGRYFADSAAEVDTYIINEAAAREFGWKDPVGKRIRGPITGQDEAFREGVVVGVARDFHFTSLHNHIEPIIMLADDENWFGNYIYVKLNPLHHNQLVEQVEAAFRKVWPDQAFEWEYLDNTYDAFYAKDRQMKSIFEYGLVISVLVCCLGIFSISALLLNLRMRESCIRKVVGASAPQLFVLHTATFLRLTIVAVIVACPVIAYLSSQWLQNFAYHVSLQLIYFIAPALLAMLITLLTSGYHGIRSGRINLTEALKEE